MTAVITHATERETTWQHSWQTIHAGVFKVGERVYYKRVSMGVATIRSVVLKENMITAETDSGFIIIAYPQDFIKEIFIPLVYNQMYGVHISLN